MAKKTDNLAMPDEITTSMIYLIRDKKIMLIFEYLKQLEQTNSRN